jgi:hypothetical protein
MTSNEESFVLKQAKTKLSKTMLLEIEDIYQKDQAEEVRDLINNPKDFFKHEG